MRRNLLLSIVVILLSSSSVYSQEKQPFNKNQLGIQFNPYFNEDFFTLSDFYLVSALRYNRRFTKNISTGLELSYISPVAFKFNIHGNHYIKLGFISRYTVRSLKRFQIFAEASPYLLYTQGQSFLPPSQKFQDYRYGVYIAPGVSIYSKNRRFSLDLYNKFSNQPFLYGKKSVISYKFNYNF